MAASERAKELREQVRRIRDLHSAIWENATAEERQQARNRRDEQIVIALEIIADSAKKWPNGGGDLPEPLWMSILKQKGSGPVILFLLGLLGYGWVTGKVKLSHLISFFSG